MVRLGGFEPPTRGLEVLRFRFHVVRGVLSNSKNAYIPALSPGNILHIVQGVFAVFACEVSILSPGEKLFFSQNVSWKAKKV